MEEIKSYKILDVNFPPPTPVKNAVIYVLNQETDKVEGYITDVNGNLKPLKDNIGGGDLLTFLSSDSTISISGTETIDIKLASSLTSLINSALQSGDNISELTNDIGYLTSFTETDPVFTASVAASITASDIASWNASSSSEGVNETVNVSDGSGGWTATTLGITGNSIYAMSGTDIHLIPNTGAGVVNVNTSRIVQIVDPVNAQDAVTKAYYEANMFSPSDLLTDYGITLSTVAVSNDYNDLDNLPSIPTAYTDEQAQDAVATAFAAGTTTRISIGYVDGSNLFNFTVDDDLSSYDNSITQFISIGANISDLTNDSGYITGYTVTEGDVTAHEAALSITESQISDLGSYLENIVEDTSPTLGGDLDADNNSITNIDNIEVEGHAYSQEIDNGNSSTADTIDWTAGNFQKSTLTDDCTYTFTAPTGTTTLILKLIQDGTGSRIATFPASVKWSGGTAPTLTTTADAIDIISFYYDGTNYYGGSILDLQ